MPKTKIVKKCENDKFYTNHEVSKLLVGKFEELNIEYNSVLEPSAGDGSFSKQFNTCVAIDIEPSDDSILKYNYFNYICDLQKPTLIVGNPPFGNRNSLSKDFIKKACVDGDIIAFVLPEVFEKPINQRVFPKNWDLVLSEKLSDNSFIFENNPYHVPCVFQVWVRSELNKNLTNIRKHYTIPKESSDWFFSKKDDCDFFVFGSAPSNLINVEDVEPNNRGYYIKVKNYDNLSNVISLFEESDWKNYGKSSVNGGVYWLNKQELVETYEKLKVK